MITLTDTQLTARIKELYLKDQDDYTELRINLLIDEFERRGLTWSIYDDLAPLRLRKWSPVLYCGTGTSFATSIVV